MQSASNVITSLFWSKEPVDEVEDEKQTVLEQYVQSVDDFSSQYGSEISISYTALNLRGGPANFPAYGDYPQTFVMRTYGTWWDEAPSGTEDYMPINNNSFTPSQDFVEVSFDKEVYPIEVSIFETYNPGALVRIWAQGPTSWMLLWEGEPEYVVEQPRIFKPPIKQINVPTRILRLEFNHKLLPYYTELDAIMLKGRIRPNVLRENNNLHSSLFLNTSPVMKQVVTVGAHEPRATDTKRCHQAADCILGQLMSKILESNLHKKLRVEIDTGPPDGDFQKLPDETVLNVMSYLDLQSLCRCAQVNRLFNRLALDSTLYRNIDLRPYWHCVNKQVLNTLSQRCNRNLQKLDISWCGSHQMIQSPRVVEFLEDCGQELTHLRMNCCRFVETQVLKAIAEHSLYLEELCLRSVVGSIDWQQLRALTMLKRLDLYRTDITGSAVARIIKRNPYLEHLNVGSCNMITNMDYVAKALGRNCPNLISVDFWKSFSLTPWGIRELGRCENLQELDVGWCLQIGGSGEWLQWLAGSELKKVFLGALRGISDRDLQSFIPRVPKLTQLDLLGVRAITPDICTTILAKCKKLRLLDISFCDLIYESQVLEWRKQYPHVSIKRSFQSTHPNGSEPDVAFLAPDMQ